MMRRVWTADEFRNVKCWNEIMPQLQAASAAEKRLSDCPPDASRLQHSRHNPGLDGLRGIAILLVFTSHYLVVDPSTPFRSWLQHLIQYNRGVDLFFVLSGYLITGILWDTKGCGHYYRNFYMRRILRVIPVYYAVLILCHMNLSFIYPRNNVYFARSEIWYWTYLMNNHLALNIYNVAKDNVTSHFWSLCVEEQYYLVWPLVVMLLNRKSLMLMCGGLAAGSFMIRFFLTLHGEAYDAVYMFTPARLDGLALGSFIAVLVRSPGGLSVLRRLIRPLVIFPAALVFILAWLSPDPIWNDHFGNKYGIIAYSLLAAGCVGAVAVRRPGSYLTWFFSLAIFRALGKYSYGLYIYHLLLKKWVEGLSGELINSSHFLTWLDQLGGWSGSDLAVRFFLCLAILFLIAYLSYNYFEKDFLILKDKFKYE